jgi:hypothetical protein
VRTSKNLFTEDRKDHEDNPFDERANAWSQLFSGRSDRNTSDQLIGAEEKSVNERTKLPQLPTDGVTSSFSRIETLGDLCTADIEDRARAVISAAAEAVLAADG